MVSKCLQWRLTLYNRDHARNDKRGGQDSRERDALLHRSPLASVVKQA